MNETEYRIRSQKILADIEAINKKIESEIDGSKRKRLYEQLIELHKESENIFRELINSML
jgi:hypothetical protein